MGDLAWWSSSDGWEIVGKGVTSSNMEYIMIMMAMMIMITIMTIMTMTTMTSHDKSAQQYQAEPNLCKH